MLYLSHWFSWKALHLIAELFTDIADQENQWLKHTLDMRARRAVIIRLLCEKTLSTGSELAGMQNSLSNRGCTLKSRNRFMPVQTKSGRKCRSWCRWCSGDVAWTVHRCLAPEAAMTCGSTKPNSAVLSRGRGQRVSRPRPRPEARGRGRGQIFGLEASLASRL